MDQEKLYQLQEKVGGALISLHDSIEDICKSLSDIEIRELADHYHVEALPTDSHNFAMPMYEEIAFLLEGELGMRTTFRSAEEYMTRTGEAFYCVACSGACKGHD